MIAKHSVKVNGKWYRTGGEVTSFDTNSTKQYTKTEIARMSKAELQALATDVGIENAFDISGGELKKLLIEHFEL